MESLIPAAKRYGHMRHTLRRHCVTLLLAGSAWGTSGAALAALECDAPWMHKGGGFTMSVLPAGIVLEVEMLDFKKTHDGNCSGTLRANGTLNVAGRTSRSQNDMALRIVDGHARFGALSSDGSVRASSNDASMAGSVSAQTAGLLGYVGESLAEGATLPGTRSEVSFAGTVSAMGMNVNHISLPKAVVTTTAKRIGKPEQLDTVAGRLVCVPISYDQTQQAAKITMLGHATTVPAATQHVVDHFCPATGLVMFKDAGDNGKSGAVKITAMH
ncbi:hypothetical protein [Burkholderia ubonensis]|uniref:hypothetical protein n=1 Tax=Burkholderia ubonensis TaxID=101571 RepID=UPI0011773E69|nr:hypothetical protein [Burkholderia ubonensis]